MYLMLINRTALSSWKSDILCLALAHFFECQRDSCLTSASDLPEPALLDTCGITAGGGCTIQVQVSGTHFSSCAI